MLKGTFVMFDRVTNGQLFSKDCLLDIAKANKDKICKIGNNTAIVQNIRLYKGKVIADFIFLNLIINTSGRIDSKVDLPGQKHGVITGFTITKTELIEIKGK